MTYYENEVVYVMIPKGDFSKQKYIIGRKVDEDDGSSHTFHFKLPFDNFVGLENLTYEHQDETFKYLANHPYHGVSTDTSVELNANSDLNHIWSWTRESDYPVIETKLGVAAAWRVLLGKYRPRSGRYGFRIDVTGRTRAVEGENSKIATSTYWFTNADMYGNTYAFAEPTEQQIIFDISNFLTLNKIDIWFYQDHKFVDQYNINIAYQDPVSTDPAANNLPPNIIVNDLQVMLGLTTDECTTDRVFLYTYDDMYYGWDPLEKLDEYRDYHAEYINIQMSDTTDEEKQEALHDLVARYSTQVGYEWLKPERTLKFAWVHLDDRGNPILINHYADSEEHDDTSSFEYWERTVGAQLQWYHYEYACEMLDDLPSRQGGVNWKYLGPTTGENYNEYVVIPDATRARDQWKAIVSVNNVPYTTDPLIFTNVDTTVETAAYDTLNEITLRFLREDTVEVHKEDEGYDFDDEDDNVEVVTNIIEDNTLRDFYVYDENNRVIKDKDNVSYADRWYYVQIWLRNNDNGQYLPLTYDPDQGKMSVSWDFDIALPRDSMISSWSVPTAGELKNAVLAPVLEGASTVYNEQILAITRKFKIRDYWDLAYLNNTIKAVVHRRTKTYRPQMELHFGQAGSMGSEYTIVFSQLEPEGQYFIEGQQFAIAANVIKKGESVQASANNKFNYSWEVLSPTIITPTANERLVNGEIKQVLTRENGAYGQRGNIVRGYIRNDMPPVFKVTVSNAADYPISAVIGMRVINQAAAASVYTTNCPSRVEFKSDGTVPLALMSAFYVEKFSDGASNEIYPKWTLEQYYHQGSEWQECKDYLSLAKEVVYDTTVATNTNPIIYYALLPSGEMDLDSLFTSTRTATNTESAAFINIQIKIQEAYDNTINSLTGTEQQLLELKMAAEQLRVKREQNLAMAAAKLIEGNIHYKLNPYIRNDERTSSWYWEDGMLNYYTVLQWTDDNVICRQAVPFARNLYSSSLLNSWDGKLTIDENENAILAQMISAGVKDSNNSFTGVIMGDWSDRGDTSLDVPGLYGLKYGAQVFGFRTDGTGFIGKSGRGRIEFDGNKSLISNADKTMYLNLDPITYYADADKLTFKNYTGYSPYFLYAETNKSSNGSLVGEDKFETCTTWANKFMDDGAKDYFIVDPNNGVLTTGGIIARYGKIGNWIISSAGLYQKYTGDSLTDSRYMYLGYPSYDSSAMAAHETEQRQFIDKINLLKQHRDSDLEFLYTTYLTSQIQFIGEYYKPIYVFDPQHFWNQGWPFYVYCQALQALLNDMDENPNLPNVGAKLEEYLIQYISTEHRTTAHMHYDPYTFEPVQLYTNGGLHYYLSQVCKNIVITPETGSNGSTKDDVQYTVSFTDVTTSSYTSLNLNGNTTWANYFAYQSNTSFNDAVGQNISSERFNNKYASFGAPSYYVYVFSTKNTDRYSLTRDRIKRQHDVLYAYYLYQLDGYKRQLNEMLAAGTRELKQTERYTEFKEMQQKLEKEYFKQRENIQTQYEQLIAAVKKNQVDNTQQFLVNDKNTYAIFAGYTPTTTPLFSVNWRGYMTARAGKIGEKSPWYISDEGLTQKNNSGTIFLGNPDSRSDGSGWTDLGLSNDMNDLTDVLLPNDSVIYKDDKNKPLPDLRGPRVLGTSDDEDNPTYGRFAIYAGSKGKIWSYNSELQQYERINETSASIKFGVRMDGTLFATSGQIGGWQITHNMFYSGDPLNYKIIDEYNRIKESGTADEKRAFARSVGLSYWRSDDAVWIAVQQHKASFMVLDAERGVINLNNAVVLTKDGQVTLGIIPAGSNMTSGKITIAGLQFIGENTGSFSYTVPTYKVTSSEVALSSNEYNYWGSEAALTTVTVDTGSMSKSGTLARNMSLTGKLSIIDTNTSYTVAPGIIIGTGTTSLDNTTKETVVIYPTTAKTSNATLGTKDNPWDLIAQTIIADTLDVTKGTINATNLFMNNKLVATQEWVKDKLNSVYAAIQDAASGASSAGARAYSAGKTLAGAINSKIKDITDFLEGKYFLNPSNESSTYSTGALQWVYSGGYPRIAVAAQKVEKVDDAEDTVIKYSTNTDDDKQGKAKKLGLSLEEKTLQSIIIPAGFVIVEGAVSGKYPEKSILPYLTKDIAFIDLNGKGTTSYGSSNFNGTTLKLGLGINVLADKSTVYRHTGYATIDYGHTHTLTLGIDANGKVTGTVGNANFSKVVSDIASVDITSSSWYKGLILDINNYSSYATIQIPNCPKSRKTISVQGGGDYSNFGLVTNTQGWQYSSYQFTDAKGKAWYLVWNYAESPYLTIS